MFNPHPPLSSVPIVLVALVGLVEFLSWKSRDPFRWKQSLSLLIILLACLLPVTYYSGYFGLDFAEARFQVPDEAVLEHQVAAKAALFLSLGMSFCFVLSVFAAQEKPRVASRLRFLYRALLFCLVLALVGTGYLGGKLVFTYGAGVEVGAK